MTEDKAIENDPFFISSQWRLGHILSEGDLIVVDAMYQEWSALEDQSNEAFIAGYEWALREIGGEELVEAKQRKDAERFDEILKRTLDKFRAEHTKEVE